MEIKWFVELSMMGDTFIKNKKKSLKYDCLTLHYT